MPALYYGTGSGNALPGPCQLRGQRPAIAIAIECHGMSRHGMHAYSRLWF